MLSIQASHCVCLCMLVLTTRASTGLAFQKFSYFFQQQRQGLLQHGLTTGDIRQGTAAVRRVLADRSSSMSAATVKNDSIPSSSLLPLPLTSSSSSNSSEQREREQETSRRLVVVLAGPTAAGKSRVAAKLCADLQQQQHQYHGRGGGGMIVSADSVQAYRGVEIGANKPTCAEREETPHFLLDMADADTKYNAAEWTRDALYAIDKLLLVQNNDNVDDNFTDDDMDEPEDALDEVKERLSSIDDAIQQAKSQKSISLDTSVVPVVVGGTMMYLTWLVHGRPDALRPSDSAIYKAAMEIQKYHQQSTATNKNSGNESSSDSDNGWDGAMQTVAALGATFAQQVQKLSGNDWYRLRRILEVAYTSMEEEKGDKIFTNNNTAEKNDAGDDTSKVTLKLLYSGEREGGLLLSLNNYDVRCFFLCPDDRMQHSKVIDERCEQMLLRGLIQETANLWLSGQLSDMACKAIGYRQTLDYLLQRPTNADHQNTADYKKTAFHAYLQDFCTATRRYSKKQMQWFRKDEAFVFVPISLLDTATATEHASKEIQRMLNLSRLDFDKERLDPAGVSAETRGRNEAQGAKMKVYQHQPRILHQGSKELEAILQQADDCTNRVQNAKKPRR